MSVGVLGLLTVTGTALVYYSSRTMRGAAYEPKLEPVLEASARVLLSAAGRLRDAVEAHELVHDHLPHFGLLSIAPLND